MTMMDFITDHLINFDGIFDKHLNGDEQKPHKPLKYNLQHSICRFIQEIKIIEIKIAKTFVSPDQIKISNYKNALYSYNAVFILLRPPIIT